MAYDANRDAAIDTLARALMATKPETRQDMSLDEWLIQYGPELGREINNAGGFLLALYHAAA